MNLEVSGVRIHIQGTEGRRRVIENGPIEHFCPRDPSQINLILGTPEGVFPSGNLLIISVCNVQQVGIKTRGLLCVTLSLSTDRYINN